MVEPRGDRHLSGESSRKLSPVGPGGGLDRGMQEEEAVPRRWSPTAQVLEERPLRPQDLHRARGEPGETVEAPGLRDHPRGQLGAEQRGEVRGPHRRRSADGLLERLARLCDPLVQLTELPSGLEETGVRGGEARSRLPLDRRFRGAPVVPGVEIGHIPGDPASESLANEVAYPVEVGSGPYRFLDMDGRVPRGVQGDLGIREESGDQRRPVRRDDRPGHGKRGTRVESHSVVGEPAIPAHPVGRGPLPQ